VPFKADTNAAFPSELLEEFRALMQDFNAIPENERVGEDFPGAFQLHRDSIRRYGGLHRTAIVDDAQSRADSQAIAMAGG
jgi:hypothetical protein